MRHLAIFDSTASSKCVNFSVGRMVKKLPVVADLNHRDCQNNVLKERFIDILFVCVRVSQ